MGIHVHLAIVEERVSDEAWRRIYEQARRVVTQWLPRPLSLAWRQIGAERVAQYGLDVEAADGLHVVGDAETLATGESFVFPARLDAWRRERAAAPGRGGGDGDVLVALGRWLSHGPARRISWCDLLGSRTRGLPYHGLIVALGLLAEHALPGAAVVYGDISARDGERARRGLAAILGGDWEPPIVVDGERLRRRLAGALEGDALDHAVRMLGGRAPYGEAMAIAGEPPGVAAGVPDARLHHELEHVAPACRDLDRLGDETRRLLHRIVEAIRSNMVLGALPERIERWGAARTREEIARRTEERGIRLTSVTWDAIEAAGLDELAFLYGATVMDTTRWEIHQAVRALLENRALRRA